MTRPIDLETAVAIGRDFVARVASGSGGKASLTGEYPDAFVLDHLLAPHLGQEDPPEEVRDFAAASGVYLGLWLLRFWSRLGLPVFWVGGALEVCGPGVHVPREDGPPYTFVLRVPGHVMAMVASPPDPFPQYVGSWMSRRGGDPLLPRYLLGAALLSHPYAEGDHPSAPPGEGPQGEAHRALCLEELALSCARDLVPEDGLRRRLLTDLYAAVLWPPVGSFGNDYGTENLRLLAKAAAFAGPENREELLFALEAMERGWMADGAFLGGLARRVLVGRDDLPEERLGFQAPEVRDLLAEGRRIFADAGLLS